MNTFPKFTPLGGCYNYTKLKKEGLVENPDESDEIESEKEFTPENDPYGCLLYTSPSPRDS